MATTRRTRREWLIEMAAALAPLALGRGASAHPYETVPGYSSKDEFKRDCANTKGGKWDEGKYSTSCTYAGNAVKVCDEQGKNCTWHPPAEAQPPDPRANLEGDISSLPDLAVQPAVAAPPATGKRKQGNKRRKRR